MKTFLPLFLFLSLTLSAHARLGDTKDQLIERFGKPDLDGSIDGQIGEMLTFNKTGFRITVTMLDGHSEGEVYEKQTGDMLNDDERQHLLSINSHGQNWKSTGRLEWFRDDGATAKGNKMTQMIFVSKKFYDAIAEAYKKAHSSSMDGF